MAFKKPYNKDIPLLGKTQIGWKIYLSHREVENISNGASALSAILAATGVGSSVISVIKGASLGLQALCKLGGHDGVKIVYLKIGIAWAQPR